MKRYTSIVLVSIALSIPLRSQSTQQIDSLMKKQYSTILQMQLSDNACNSFDSLLAVSTQKLPSEDVLQSIEGILANITCNLFQEYCPRNKETNLNNDLILQLLDKPKYKKLFDNNPALAIKLLHIVPESKKRTALVNSIKKHGRNVFPMLEDAITEELYVARDSRRKERALSLIQLAKSIDTLFVLEGAMRHFTDTNSAIAVGKPVPPFFLRAVDGDDSISNTALLGSTYLIDFWGPYCKPCVKSIPELNRLYEKHKTKKFTIISHVSASNAELRDLTSKLNITYPVYVSIGGTKNITQKLQASWVPTYMLVDKNGIIRALDYDLRGSMLAPAIEKLLE